MCLYMPAIEAHGCVQDPPKRGAGQSVLSNVIHKLEQQFVVCSRKKGPTWLHNTVTALTPGSALGVTL